MDSGGFTEDDQARIAEDVLGRVGGKRSGLGFSADAQTATATAFASSSGWFDQRSEFISKEENVSIGTHDTTEGPFAWSAGQREKAGGAARKTAASRTKSDPPQERVFPMVRDRDVQAAARDRQRSRGKSRSRSKDHCRSERVRQRDTRGGLGRNRSRSRSRSRSNGRGRREAERRRERRREREKDVQRERASERDRQRKRERNMRSRSPRSRYDNGQDQSKGVKISGSVPTAEQAKAAVKRQLRKATVKDTTLKTGATSTVGGGAGWERPEMSMASEFFTRDEISSKGGVASVAPEYEARLAEILQVEDEDTLSLQKEVPRTAGGAGSIGPSGLDPSTRRHHDAIFAPTLSTPEADTPLPPPATAPAPLSRSVGVGGAAARARLMLSGKLTENLMPSSEQAPAGATKISKKSVKNAKPGEDDSDQPLFKTLRVGETVEAQYTADDRWYKASILQTIHSGFDIARYKVKYDEYGNQETVEWTRIRRLEPTSECFPVTKKQGLLELEELVPEITVREDETPPPFAGMRPRQIRTDVIQENPTHDVKPETNEKNKVPEVGDVINPAIRSSTAGRKMSWKDRVAAKKAGLPGVAEAGVRQKKQFSLVPDFVTRRREPGNTAMDMSEWRKKVVFGMNSQKPSSDGGKKYCDGS